MVKKHHKQTLIAFLLLFSALACRSVPTPATVASDPSKSQNMVLIKGGTFLMGTDDGMAYEGPAHAVTVNSFWMDEHEVTVAEFAAFVAATHYQTEAETFGWSGVFNSQTGEWGRVDRADWRHPDGPTSQPKPDEPVCQISWRDAEAYARWAGKRLPTEAEWEYAARGGLAGKKYGWGDELRPNGKPVANWWQGQFPEHDTGEDGFTNRAPIKSFPPNGYGLYDTAGNVWEWCADWYAGDYYNESPRDNPAGPASSKERAIRGGAWMCAENFCSNYRVAARSHATPDTGLNNLGFRCARDEQKTKN
ncbi:MAG TPA: formylglycine-generating enzyme family protein [Pyrinomonadaceae bacterium]|nr:formylglycine-generating enzyme family protein [Pyrinomonadaceae bacterium]